jgi:hypothetical protein
MEQDRTKPPKGWKIETNGRLFRMKEPDGSYFGGADNTVESINVLLGMAWDRADAAESNWTEVDFDTPLDKWLNETPELKAEDFPNV